MKCAAPSNAALNASLQTPEAVTALRRIGAERDKWREVVRLSGIKIE